MEVRCLEIPESLPKVVLVHPSTEEGRR